MIVQSDCMQQPLIGQLPLSSLSEEKSQKLGLIITLLGQKADESDKSILKILGLVCELSMQQKKELSMLRDINSHAMRAYKKLAQDLKLLVNLRLENSTSDSE